MKIKLMIQSKIGELLYFLGFQPSFSTSIADTTTAGYGELDEFGFWQYPVEFGFWLYPVWKKEFGEP